MRAQRVEVAVFLHVGGVLEAVLHRLPQSRQGALGVVLRPFLALGLRKLTVSLGQRDTAGQAAGGVVSVVSGIDGRLQELVGSSGGGGVVPEIKKRVCEDLA